MIDIYVCHDAQHADRILDILRSEGLTPLLRDRSSSAFPTQIGIMGEQLIAVHEDEAPKARTVISAAIEDGVVPEEGELVT